MSLIIGASAATSCSLEGELVTELQDGRRFVLGPGVSYQVADGDGAHRSVSPKGARLFIVD
jgi:hypothetical protein